MEQRVKRVRKLRSKLERLRIRDDIVSFLKMAPLEDMREDQVGNHVYSGRGKMRVGPSYASVVVRIRMKEGALVFILLARAKGISITCPFEPKQAAEAIRKAIKKNLN